MDIVVRNFRGISEAEITLSPVALICGPNGAGKSSIAQAVSAALCRNPAPIEGMKKGDAKMLLREGEKRGRCTVKAPSGSATANWPGGSVTDENGPAASLIALGLASIPEMKPKDSAPLMIKAMNALPDVDDLAEALPHIDPPVIDAVWAKVEKDGWDSAHKRARDRSLEFKGSWSQITGESWGSKKGEDWKPGHALQEEPACGWDSHIASLKKKLEDAIADSSAERQAVRNLQGQADQVDGLRSQLLDYEFKDGDALPDIADLEKELETALSNRAADAGVVAQLEEDIKLGSGAERKLSGLHQKIDNLAEKIRFAEDEIVALPHPVHLNNPVECPHCAGLLEVISRTEVKKLADGIDDAENQARQNAIDKARGNLGALKQEHGDALESRRTLNAIVYRGNASQEKLDSMPSGNVSEEEVDYLKKQQQIAREIHRLNDLLALALDAVESLKNRPAVPTEKDIQDIRDEITEAELSKSDTVRIAEASKLHKQIISNNQIAAVLAPDGLRREKLESRLASLNDKIGALCDAASWRRVAILGDLSVVVEGRPYQLLSESEKFRARVVLQLILAEIDKSSMVVIDAADILDRDGRNGLFSMLRGRGIPVLVCMTMNRLDDVPNLAQAGIGLSYWIGDSVLAKVN